MPTRLKYDGLPEGAHTFTYIEKEIEKPVCPEHGFGVPLYSGKCASTVRDDAGPHRCGSGVKTESRLFIVDQPRIEKGDVVEVEDLNDPKSERARICRGHVDRGIAHVIGEKAPKKDGPAKG